MMSRRLRTITICGLVAAAAGCQSSPPPMVVPASFRPLGDYESLAGKSCTTGKNKGPRAAEAFFLTSGVLTPLWSAAESTDRR